MDQNTLNWHEWRRKGIGASDAPVIMGVSKYKTPWDLFREKIGEIVPDDERNFVGEKGHHLEAKARAIFELLKNDAFPPALVEKKGDIFRASLDGYNGKEVWEGKYVGQEKFIQVVATKEPLEEHLWQLVHQMIVTGAEKIHYMVYICKEDEWAIDDYFIVEFVPTKEQVLELMRHEDEFWKSVVTGKMEPGSKDFVEVTNIELDKLFDTYARAKKDLGIMEKGLDIMKKVIIQNLTHPRMENDKLKVTHDGRTKFYVKK